MVTDRYRCFAVDTGWRTIEPCQNNISLIDRDYFPILVTVLVIST